MIDLSQIPDEEFFAEYKRRVNEAHSKMIQEYIDKNINPLDFP